MITEDRITDYRLEHGVTRDEAIKALGLDRQENLENKGLGEKPSPKDLYTSVSRDVKNFRQQDRSIYTPVSDHRLDDFTESYNRLKNFSGYSPSDLESLKSTPDPIENFNVSESSYKQYENIFDTINDDIDQFGTKIKTIDDSRLSPILKLGKEAEKKALSESLGKNHAKTVDDIKAIAKSTTGYYDELVDENGKFKDHVDELPYTRLHDYTSNEHMFWKDLAIKYNSILDEQGEIAAKNFVHKSLNDLAFENSTVGGKLVKLANRWGNDAVGLSATVIGVAGGVLTEALKAGYAGLNPNYEYNETNANGWLHFWDSALDNSLTRVGSDVMTYGLWNTITGESDKMRESGYHYTGNTFEEAPDGSFWNRNLGFNIASFMGFTGAMRTFTKGAGYTTKLLSEAASNVAKKEVKNAAIKKFLNLSSKSLESTSKGIEKSTPWLLGTVEGDMAYIDTKSEVYRTGIENSKMVFQNKNQERFWDEYKNNSKFNAEINKKLEEFYYGHIAAGKSEEEAEVAAQTDAYNYGVDYLKEQHIDEWKALEENADIQSKRAGLWDFGMHQIIDGIVLHGAQRRLIDPSWNKVMRFKQKFKYTNTNGKTNVSSNKVSTGRQAWEYSKEPVGEFVQEFGATVIDNSTKSFGDYSIENYLKNYAYSGDAFSELGKYTEGSVGYLWDSIKENAQSKEAFISGVYGAIGSLVGTYDISVSNYYGKRVNKNGTVDTGFKFRKQANETWWEYARRITPMSNPILQAHDGLQDLKNRVRKNTSRLQAIIDNDDSEKGLLTAAKILAWEKSLEESTKAEDSWGARHSSLGAVIQTVIALENSNSEIWKPQMLKHLEAVSKITEATEEEQSQYIAEIRQENSELYKDMSDQEILQMSENNAKNMLSMLEAIREESKKIDEALPNIDIETKEAILFSKIRAKQAEQSKTEIDKELDKLKINNSVDNSGMTEDEKKASLKYGSVNIEESLNENKETLQKTKISLETKKKKLKETKDKEEKSKIKKEIQKEKDKIFKLESRIKSLEKDLKYSDKISTTVLSEQEIMSLSAVDRAKLFNSYKRIVDLEKIIKDSKIDDSTKEAIEQMLKTEKSKISEKQMQVLDNLIKQAQVNDGKFVEKVIFAGEYQKIIDDYAEDYSRIAKDNDYLRKYIAEAKVAAKKSMAKSEYDKLLTLNNIQDFDKAFRDLADRDYNAAVLIAENLEGSDFKLWKEFNDIEKNQALWSDALSEAQKTDGLSQNEKLNVLGTLRYLNVKGINANNSDEVLAALVDPETGLDNKEYVDYLFNLYKNNGSYAFLGFGISYGLIQKYTQKHEDNIKDNENLKGDNSTIILEDSEIEEDLRNDDVENLENVSKESESKNNEIEIENIQQDQETKTKENIASFIEQFKDNTIEDESLITAKNKLLNLLNSSDSSFAFSTSLKNIIDGEINEDIKNALTKIVDSYILTKFDGVRPGYKKENVNPNSGKIETSNMSWISKEFPNSPISKFWKTHKIGTYLNKNSKSIESGKKDVLFITDDSLTEEVRLAMGENYEDSNDLPIIAVVQDNDGLIEIDGVKYQPIAILPASDNINKNGVNRVNSIRKQAIQQGKGSKIIKDSNFNIIKSSVVGTIVPNKLRQSESPVSVLSSTQQTTDKDSEEYKKSKTQFFSNLKVVKFENRSGIIHTSEDGSTVEIFVQPIERSTHNISGENIEQTFDKTAEQILEEYDDTQEAFDIIKNKLRYNSLIIEAANTIYRSMSSVFKNLNAETIEGKSENEIKQLLNEIVKSLNFTVGSSGVCLNTPQGFEWRILRKYDASTKSFIPGEYELAFGYISDNNIDKNRKIVSIPLNTNTVENIKNESIKIAYNTIKQLCLNDSGKVREGEERKEQHYDMGAFVRFNVSFYEFVGKTTKQNGQTQQNIEYYKSLASAVYDDGLLFSMYQEYSSEPGNVVLAGPRREVEDIDITNSDNADFAQGVSEIKPNKTVHNNNPKDVENIVTKMVEDSKHWELSEEDKYYVEDEKPSKHVRVTSLIQADTEVTKFDQDSPYVLPSTTFGNNIDNLVREAVSIYANISKEGKSIEDAIDEIMPLLKTVAPNISKNDAINTVNQVFTTLSILQLQGYKVISDKIVARGNIKIADSKGVQHSLNVAGTIDLLMYNEITGEYNIIDIKTKRGGGFTENSKIMQKYAKQLYLYKTFLESTYGIKISNTYVMGFSIGYIEPIANIIEYSTDNSEILKINTPSTRDEIATPSVVTMEHGNGIGGLHKVTTKGVQIKYEDLDDYIRDTEVEISDLNNPTTGTEAAKKISEFENNNSETVVEVKSNQTDENNPEEDDEKILETINYRKMSASSDNAKDKAIERIISQIEKNKKILSSKYQDFKNSKYYKNLNNEDKIILDNIIEGEINESEEDWLYELFKNEKAALAIAALLSDNTNNNIKTSSYLKQAEKECK